MEPDGRREESLKSVVEEFQDCLAPRLDTYEQAIYLYIFRHSRLLGRTEVTVGFKSARRKMAFGVGEKGKPMSEGTCYEKLRSLQSKGCVDIIDTTRDGTKLRLKLPSEIPGVVRAEGTPPIPDLERADFFTIPENRLAILRREGNQCFYCLRAVDASNYVIEHVTSRPEGDNSFRNVVAACRGCNNRKGEMSADDFLRMLYRSGYLGPEELEGRLAALDRLRKGSLRPDTASLA
jgi:5-methylcytosine-specific restriction endonuclease McrA